MCYLQDLIYGRHPWWFFTRSVCWDCRILGNTLHERKHIKNKTHTNRKCPSCANIMTKVGYKFKAPCKNNIKKWKLLQKTWEVQYICENGVYKYIGPINQIIIAVSPDNYV